MIHYYDKIKELIAQTIIDEENNYKYNEIFFTIFRFGLCFYILFSSLGNAPRQIGSIIAFIGIIFYYSTFGVVSKVAETEIYRE